MRIPQQILSEVCRVIKSEEFVKRHRTQETAFTRNRKLGVADIMQFVLTLQKTTQPFAIKRYSGRAGQTPVAPGSMTKARTKLSWTAFREVLSLSRTTATQPHRFQGYTLIALDGMQGDLPRTKELLRQYPPEGGSRIPKFHAVSAYDVLNGVFLDAEFLPSPCDEREAASALIHSLALGSNDVLIFDRGFPSIRLLQLLDERKIPYVMRVSRSFLTEVNCFTVSNATDAVIDILYTSKRAAASRIQCKTPWDMRVRAVRVPLQKGGEEILLTSLMDLSADALAEIYRLRWGIETSHNYLKNALHLESFMGTLENSIKQEFYAALFAYNIASMLCKEAEKQGLKKLQIQASAQSQGGLCSCH